jgi:hypothetical protein
MNSVAMNLSSQSDGWCGHHECSWITGRMGRICLFVSAIIAAVLHLSSRVMCWMFHEAHHPRILLSGSWSLVRSPTCVGVVAFERAPPQEKFSGQIALFKMIINDTLSSRHGQRLFDGEGAMCSGVIRVLTSAVAWQVRHRCTCPLDIASLAPQAMRLAVQTWPQIARHSLHAEVHPRWLHHLHRLDPPCQAGEEALLPKQWRHFGHEAIIVKRH